MATNGIRRDNVIGYGNDWLQSRPQAIPWIWEGVIAQEAVTLLSGSDKVGKTTLLSLLLDRRREGGELLGRKVRPGRTILCSEENDRLWRLRQPPLDFGCQLEYHPPQESYLSMRRWRRYIDHLLGFAEGYYDLLVVDSVMSFLPATENNPRALRRALEEFRVVANLPVAILLLHQTYAARSRTRARGPLAAFADILLHMQIPGADPFTRRRHFHGVGRYPGALEQVAAELNPEGTDYRLLPYDPMDPAAAPALETVRHLLGQSPTPLTRLEILARWPEGERAPHPESLWRTLMRACELGLLIRTGVGNKAEAFRYGLAGGQCSA